MGLGGGHAGDVAACVLVVEDDPSLSEVICTYLGMNGCTCVPAFSGTEARLLVDKAVRPDAAPLSESASAPPFDVVVCDLMLPGMAGEELVAYIRGLAASREPSPEAARLADVPIVVISAKGQVADRVSLLRGGADDYLVKPFPLEELLARIEVQLRRGACLGHAAPGGAVPPPKALRFGRWRACRDDRSFSVDGRAVRLTRTEFDIVWLLMANPRRVFTRYELLDAVHDGDGRGEEKTASTHVGNIRAKLKGTGTEGYIETVWGIGFKLTADPA